MRVLIADGGVAGLETYGAGRSGRRSGAADAGRPARRLCDRPLIVDEPFAAGRARRIALLAAVNLPPKRAMYLLARTDPTLTMRVHQQGEGGVQRLEQAIGCTIAGVRTAFRPGSFGTQ
jgi:hypothetical protein